MSKRMAPWILFVAAIMTAWSLCSFLMGPLAVPRPIKVWNAFSNSLPQHLHNTLVSAGLATGGLLVASAFAGGFILLTCIIPSVRYIFYPYFVIIKCTPALALAPILMCLVGIGVWCKVLVAASISFFPLVIGGVDALLWMPDGVTILSDSYGSTRWRFTRNVSWGYTLSGFLTGMKTAAPLAVVGALVGEFVSAGTPSGLGMFILSNTVSLQRAEVFVGAILSCITGLSFFALASIAKSAAERRLHLGR